MRTRWPALGLGIASSIGGCASPPPPAPPTLGGLPPGLAIARLRDYETLRVSSNDRSGGNADYRRIEPGQTLALAEVEGPGAITHLWFTIAMREEGFLRKLVLRAYWDGEATPSVEAPVGDFFGLGHGGDLRHFYSNAFLDVSPQLGLNAYFPMPFRERARLTVTNEGEKRCDAFYYYVDAVRLPRLPDDVGYFHAQYRQAFPCKPGEPFLFLEARGRGHLLGVNLAVETTRGGWWGEGDDLVVIDGEEERALRGTGTEDYFCGAWNFRAAHAAPYSGSPRLEAEERAKRHFVYRFHATDPIPFRRSLRYAIEHGHGNDRADNYASVAFWYQVEPHAPFPPLAPAADRVAGKVPPVPRETAPPGGQVVEAEDCLAGARASGGELGPQDLWADEANRWSGERQVFWRPAKEGERLVLPFEVKADGEYEIAAFLTRSHDYARIRISLDGETLVESWDGFFPEVVRAPRVPLGRKALPAGRHELSLETIGKDERSGGFYAGLDCLVLALAGAGGGDR